MTAGTSVETAHPEPLCRPAPLRGVVALRAPVPKFIDFDAQRKTRRLSTAGFHDA